MTEVVDNLNKIEKLSYYLKNKNLKEILSLNFDDYLNSTTISDEDNDNLFHNLLLLFINNNFVHSYKEHLYFDFYKFLVDFAIKYKIKKIDCLIYELSKIKKGYVLLKRLFTKNKILHSYPCLYLNISALYGTLHNFLYWLRIFYKMENKDLYDKNYIVSFFISSVRNTDDRIYKYILNNKIIDFSKINLNNEFYHDLFSNIFNNHTPIKYALRKIKFISKFNNLDKCFKFMIVNCNNIKCLLKLMEFYYKNYVIDSSSEFIKIAELFKNLYDENNPQFEKIIINFYNKLITEKEKQLFIFFNYIENLYCYNIFLKNKIRLKNNHHVFNGTFTPSFPLSLIIQKYVDYYNFENSSKNKNLLFLLHYIEKYNIISDNFIKVSFRYKHYKSNVDLFLLPFTKFIKINHISNNRDKNPEPGRLKAIYCNRINHNLRLYIRKIRKNKIVFFRSYYHNILNEVNNFKPNPKKNILKNGSYKYRIKNHKFNKIPPYHLHIGEINYLNNYLIRLKADGVSSNIIPINTSPNYNLIKNYPIKSEYIEELDLYLVYDIDIPDMSIEERYNYLRSIHTSTKNTKLENVKKYDEFLQKIKEENCIFDSFLNMDYDNYRWYPKASWKFERSSNIYFGRELISNIILEKNNELICNGINYDCDGIIIVPLNGNREIKVKPKSKMTIDLLYKSGNWLDRENNIYNKFIKMNNKLKDNKIWRCYPLNYDKILFEPREIRFDKKNPNPSKIINNIIQLILNKWNDTVLENTYYTKNKKKSNKKWDNIVRKQNKILEYFLDCMNPLLSSDWIDFGCGFGKLYNLIEKFNPNKYIGIDNDLNCLVNCIHKFGKKINNNSNFIISDLSNNWNNNDKNWFKLDFNKKYDYFVCNFSLMHFCNNKFWNQLNLVSKTGSKMLFNLVNEKSENKINIDSNYLYLDKENNKVKYYFENVHNSETQEEYISENILNDYLIKYNWTIIKKMNNFNFITHDDIENSFHNYYNWYIIMKI